MILRGKCVLCGRLLTEADFDRQAVVAAIGPEGTIVCCTSHLAGGPGSPQYEPAICAMSEAKAAQIKAAEKAKRLHVDPEALLPDGRSCADCAHARRCQAFLGTSLNLSNEYCDWVPSRFVLAMTQPERPAVETSPAR